MNCELTIPERLEIEQACQRLIYTYSRALDTGDPEVAASCFVEHGKLARPMQPEQIIEGRAAILTSLQTRPKTLVTRHVVSNLTVDVTSYDSASATSALLMIGCMPAEGSRPPYESTGPLYFGEFRDRFARVEGEWKFLERLGSIAVKY
jgi:hypothetical protein